MAWVQGVGVQGVAVTAVTTSSITTTTGNCLVFGAGCSTGFGGDVTTVQDSKSNTWAGTPSSPKLGTTRGEKQYMYTAAAGTRGSSHTFTANLASSGYVDVNVGEFSGRAASSVVDTDASVEEKLTGGNSNFSGPTFNPQAGSDGFMAECNDAGINPSTASPASGWTIGNSQVDAASGTAGHSQYKANLSSGSQGAPWGFTSVNNASAQIVVALKAGGSGAILAGTGTAAAAATGALSTGIKLAGTPASVSSATGFLNALLGAAAVASSGTGALSTAIQLAAAALVTTNFQGALVTSAQLASDAASVTSAAGVLTNWTTVTLTAPLYTGSQGLLDPHLWIGQTPPVVGTLIYYDATHMTVSPNGELGADVTDCQAVVQYQDGGGAWHEATIIFTSGLAGYVDTVATATGAMTTAIRLLGAASVLVSATAGLNAQIQLRGQLASVASASASLVTAILLAGTITDTTTAVGALAGTDNTLAGSAVVASVAAGLLNAQIRMAGASAALVTAVGALATQIRLQGALLTTTAAIGSLTAGTQLNANAAAAAAATGALLTGIKVAGAALAIVQAAGDLTTHIQLLGAAIAASTATGDLTAHVGISGAAVAVATAVGALSSLITLQTAAFSQTSAQGALLTQIPLQGGALVTDSAAGALTATGSPVGLYPIDPYFVIGVRRQYYTERFPQVSPNEPKVLTFKFADELPLGTTLNGIISVNVVSSAGTDPGLPDDLLSAPAAYDVTRTEVVFPVHPGLQDVDYYFTVTAPVNEFESLTRFGILSVRG